MSTLKEKYRPRSLADVVGQPLVRQLQNLARNPKSCCVLLEGATGTGKSTCAQALANDLGCVEGWQESVYTLCAADLDAETARHYFGPASPFRFCAPGKGYHVLILEELEYMNKTVQVILKDALERLLAKYRVIVFATSNDSSALPKPVLHRFGLKFAMSAGQSFADSVNGWLATVWEHEVGKDVPMPVGYQQFGWESEEFSARLALDRLEKCVIRYKEQRN
jgi:replication-associated recombination protein RarA